MAGMKKRKPPSHQLSPASLVLTEKTNRRCCLVGELLVQHREEFAATRVVHDGMASLYFPRRIGDWNEKTFDDVELAAGGGHRRGTFKLRVQLVRVIRSSALAEYADTSRAPPDPTPMLQLLDVVMRHLGAQRYISSGSDLYSAKRSHALDATKELLPGVYQRVHVGHLSLFLTVENVTSVFYTPGPLLLLVLAVAGCSDPRTLVACRDRWAKTLRRFSVLTTHRPHDPVQVVCEVGTAGADTTTLKFRERGSREGEDSERIITVEEYFLQRYSIRLRFPTLQLINVGTKRAPSWVPMELCQVAPGQRVTNMHDIDTAEILRRCCKKPVERKREIESCLYEQGFQNDPYCIDFGISVSKSMERVVGRVLQPPNLAARNRHVVVPQNGGWNLSREQLYRPGRIGAWCIISLSSLPPRALDEFAHKLVRELDRCGLEVRERFPVVVTKPRGDREADIERLLREAHDRSRGRNFGAPPDLMVVIKDRVSADYAEVKHVSDSVLGVPSQCALAKNVTAARGQYLGNLALKINLKLRGLNLTLRCPLRCMDRGTTIIFGADVEYPRSMSQPAIASVVASMDASAAGYVGRVTPLSTSSPSCTFPRMMWELFAKFEERNHVNPERIIFFRNGASISRMEDVFQSEMKSIVHAWMMHSTTPMPPVTFIVASRHHHLRAFPASSRDADRSGNPPAGTVIDSGIVDPRRIEFSLYGHSGLLGTSRPAQYTVLSNENGFSEREIEQVCFDLCHMCGRSMRSVSIPAPLYYAKILAARGRCLLDFHTRDGNSHDAASTDSDASSSNGSSGFPGEPVVDVHDAVCNSLFFV